MPIINRVIEAFGLEYLTTAITNWLSVIANNENLGEKNPMPIMNRLHETNQTRYIEYCPHSKYTNHIFC